MLAVRPVDSIVAGRSVLGVRPDHELAELRHRHLRVETHKLQALGDTQVTSPSPLSERQGGRNRERGRARERARARARARERERERATEREREREQQSESESESEIESERERESERAR